MSNILKMSLADHTIECVGYCANQVDLDREFISDENVLKTAVDEFLKNPKFNINHNDEDDLTAGIEVIESKILTKGETINGQFVAPGCWLLKLKVHPDVFYLIHDGSGVSIQGKAEYEEIGQ